MRVYASRSHFFWLFFESVYYGIDVCCVRACVRAHYFP